MNMVVKLSSTEFDESLIDNNVEYSKLYFPYSAKSLCLVFICNAELPDGTDIFTASRFLRILNGFSNYISNEDKKLNFRYVGENDDIDILHVFYFIKSIFIFNFIEPIPPYLTKYGYKIVLVDKKHEEYVKDNFRLINKSNITPNIIFKKEDQFNLLNERRWSFLEMLENRTLSL